MSAAGRLSQEAESHHPSGEQAVRIDLAACFRLIARNGWDDLLATHVSARLPGTHDEFLLNPYGLFFNEIRASDLVRIDTEGRKLCDSPFNVNKAGFVIHSAIHMARPDIACVIHLHTSNGVALSTLKCGLLPISQTAMTIAHDIGYHDYEGYAINLEERARLERDLGQKNILILRNHGTLVAGASVAEAFARALFLERACEIQMKAMATGQPFVTPPDAAIAITAREADGERVARSRRELAWPALLRILDKDDPSYKE